MKRAVVSRCAPAICALAVCALALTVSCSKAENSAPDAAEMEFVSAVEAIVPAEKGFPAAFASLEEMISTTKCNLIIRGKITERGECEADGSRVTTPYTVEVSECYLGDLEVGGSFVIDAPYGIAGDASFRAEPHPILRKGAEYLMFLRCDEIGGGMCFYLASKTAGALRLTDGGFVNDTEGGSFTDSYGGDIDALITDVKAAAESGSFDTSFDVIG